MSYANPDALVSTEWLAERVGDPNIRPIEVDEDTTHYAPGHIPGAVGWDWTNDLQRFCHRRLVRYVPIRSSWAVEEVVLRRLREHGTLA